MATIPRAHSCQRTGRRRSPRARPPSRTAQAPLRGQARFSRSSARLSRVAPWLSQAVPATAESIGADGGGLGGAALGSRVSAALRSGAAKYRPVPVSAVAAGFVSCRVTARQSRFVRPRCASRSMRYSLHPISPRHASIRIAHCRAAALRVALAEAGAPPSRPAAGPTRGMRRAPRRRTCATAGRFGRGHRGCFGGGSGVATRRRARRSEGQGCCARCEIRW